MQNAKLSVWLWSHSSDVSQLRKCCLWWRGLPLTHVSSSISCERGCTTMKMESAWKLINFLESCRKANWLCACIHKQTPIVIAGKTHGNEGWYAEGDTWWLCWGLIGQAPHLWSQGAGLPTRDELLIKQTWDYFVNISLPPWPAWSVKVGAGVGSGGAGGGG